VVSAATVVERRASNEAAYARCRRMLRRHDPTFYLAVSLLPPSRRPAIHALYGFVRGADEIVDGPRRARESAERLARLDAWEGELVRGLAAGHSDHAVVGALVDAGRRLELPLAELRPYIRSMRVDCGPVRIATRAELDGYMDGSGGSIGRIMAPILGAPAAAETFARLGVAFQLTNFLRDLREDYRLDRIYLPAEELERYGVSTDDLARDSATSSLRALLAAEVGHARKLFAETACAIPAALPSARAAMRLARAVYLAVLGRIETIGYDVLGASTRPRPHQIAREALAEVRSA
jgi:15-cis-phytoene synthase